MVTYTRKDHYYKRAKKEGYPSRSAYKLKEIHQKMKLIRGGDYVVDVGCSPGGWSQVALEITGKRGRVVGIDILDTCKVRGDTYRFIQGNIEDQESGKKILKILGRKADLVISDAAPNTSGIKFTDHARSISLVRSILSFGHTLLKEGGTFLAKVFDGEETEELVKEMRISFDVVKRERLRSTRKESYEIYLVAKGFKNIP